MNRRSFLTDTLKAGIAAAFLPSALTYSRHWVRQGPIWVISDPKPFLSDSLECVLYKVRELRSGYCVGISTHHEMAKTTLIGIAQYGKSIGIPYPIPKLTDDHETKD